jgi:segregation and condensation protein B
MASKSAKKRKKKAPGRTEAARRGRQASVRAAPDVPGAEPGGGESSVSRPEPAPVGSVGSSGSPAASDRSDQGEDRRAGSAAPDPPASRPSEQAAAADPVSEAAGAKLGASEATTGESQQAEPRARDSRSTLAQQAASDGAQVGPELAAEQNNDEEAISDTRAYLKGLLEALLFVSDRPLTLKELARAAKLDKQRTGQLVKELQDEHAGRGVRIDEVGGGFVFRSSPIYARHVRRFVAHRPIRLSRAQLETLAIIAYRQPITRPEVDDIRGVDCGPVIKGLLERELVRILGKKDEPGRPMLYGTSPAFLELFGLKSLRELPTLKEFTELTADSRRAFEQQIGTEAPEGPIEIAAEREGDPEGQPAVSDDRALDAHRPEGPDEPAAEDTSTIGQEPAEDGGPGGEAGPVAATGEADAAQCADDEDDDYAG